MVKRLIDSNLIEHRHWLYNILFLTALFEKEKSHTDHADAQKTGPYTLALKELVLVRDLLLYDCVPEIKKASQVKQVHRQVEEKIADIDFRDSLVSNEDEHPSACIKQHQAR